ncbi:MAG: hypothetical protein ACR2QW_12910 [bacterium]
MFNQTIHSLSLATNLLLFAILTGLVWVVGSRLAVYADEIAARKNIGKALMGLVFLAAATELPEMATTAARIGSYTMAISNIFGSNLIMLALLLPADILYREGALLSSIDRAAQFALVFGILVTVVYMIGLLTRTKRRVFGIGVDSSIVLILYLCSLVIFYQVRG